MSEPDAPKPYAPACDRNREAILDWLRPRLRGCRRVLEIGSGTGQHAVHFAPALDPLIWQCSDRAAQLGGIRRWLDEAGWPNTPPPLALDVDVDATWPGPHFDAVFMANTLHILSAPSVERLFARVGGVLRPEAEGWLAVYGPFRIDGRPTSDSNAAFDDSLRQRDPASGLRDLEWLQALAAAQGFAFVERTPMPANNFALLWRRPVQPA